MSSCMGYPENRLMYQLASYEIVKWQFKLHIADLSVSHLAPCSALATTLLVDKFITLERGRAKFVEISTMYNI